MLLALLSELRSVWEGKRQQLAFLLVPLWLSFGLKRFVNSLQESRTGSGLWPICSPLCIPL